MRECEEMYQFSGKTEAEATATACSCDQVWRHVVDIGLEALCVSFVQREVWKRWLSCLLSRLLIIEIEPHLRGIRPPLYSQNFSLITYIWSFRHNGSIPSYCNHHSARISDYASNIYSINFSPDVLTLHIQYLSRTWSKGREAFRKDCSIPR